MRLARVGLMAPGAAFVVLLAGGFSLTQARCGTAHVAFDTLTVVLTAVCALGAVTGLAAAIVAFRRTRDQEGSPHFLSIMGMTVSPLVLAIVLMAGIGSLLLPECVQSAEPEVVRPPGDEARSPRELGAALFAANCATCHGSRGGGVVGRGPAVRGTGAQATDFYMTTGSMPLNDPDDQPLRSRPSFHPAENRALSAYVASLAPGPPAASRAHGDGSVSAGLAAFSEHCAGCHQVVGAGGVVTGAKVPPLEDATPAQIREAVRIGPYVMPRFSAHAIDGAELDDIVAYVTYAQHPRDPGGWSIDHLGPFPEGIVAWFIAGVALMLACVWVGSRVRRA